jgi:serine phosphatase RsbU (regulator of sigma subunit)
VDPTTAAPVGLGDAFGRVLEIAEDAPPAEAVEAVTRELGALLGASDVAFLIADLSGRAFVRLDGDAAEHLPYDGGPAEQTLRRQEACVLKPEQSGEGPAGHWTVLAPVTERGEALGLLQMSLPDEPGPEVLAEIARTAHLLSFVVIANRRHTDLFEWSQRTTPFTLPAEIQRRLLPAAFTCEGGSFTLSAWLEPAANVGGDTFDYSLGRDCLHLSITDAMGHGVASALIATLCVGSLRNTRRHGGSLVEQVDAANAALLEHAVDCDSGAFATGLVGRLDLRSGELALINAGHVSPYLARAGTVRAVDLQGSLPLGMFEDTSYTVTELPLEPGDRLVFVTDGMLERNAATLDLVAEIALTRGLHPREATRRLADRVLEVTGRALADDATLLILDWDAHHGRDRDSNGGADA